MPKQLVVICGLERGRVLQLLDKDVVQLGCSQKLPVEHRFRDSGVARVHCEVQTSNDQVELIDAGTDLGTYLNGKRIDRAVLSAGDVIRIGSTELRFLCDITSRRTEPSIVSPSGSAALQELVGRRLSHFKIELVVGTGHWGRVFRAYDLRAARTVALKVLRPEFSTQPEALPQMSRALKSVLHLHHPHLQTYFGAGKAGPFCWIASEYIDGHSLTHMIRRVTTVEQIEWPEALRIARELAGALKFAHKHEIIHGHITPQNIMIRASDKTTKLTDLMFAYALGRPSPHLHRAAELPDETPYLAPEALVGGGVVDCRSDVFSVGAVTYALIAGRPPLSKAGCAETIDDMDLMGVVRPSVYQRNIPERLEADILKMLSLRPEDRFQTPSELYANLERVHRGSKANT